MNGKELRGIVPVKLKGKHFKLYFSVNTLIELEDEYPNFAVLFESIQNPTLKSTRYLLWAGLQHFHEGITVEQAGLLMPFDPLKIAEIQGLVAKAIFYAIPNDDGEDDKGINQLPEDMQAFLREAEEEKLKN